MPKIKTRRATAKRFKISGSGRIKCGKANHRHLMEHKSSKQRRHSRAPGVVPEVLVHFVKQQLPYG